MHSITHPMKVSDLHRTDPLGLYRTDKFGTNTDWTYGHNYAEFYDLLFAPWRERPLAIVEIGVWSGGSVRLWHDYFPRATVVGVDSCNRWEGPSPSEYSRLTLRFRDAYDLAAWPEGETFDILIDDGTHHTRDQECVLRHLRSRIRPGGVLILEDVYDVAIRTLTKFEGVTVHVLSDQQADTLAVWSCPTT